MNSPKSKELTEKLLPIQRYLEELYRAERCLNLKIESKVREIVNCLINERRVLTCLDNDGNLPKYILEIELNQFLDKVNAANYKKILLGLNVSADEVNKELMYLQQGN